MATPWPPPAGDDCARCDSRLWATGKTPLFVKAKLSELVVCPAAPSPAPNGIWVLQQSPTRSCQFLLTTNLYSFSWELAADGSYFDVVDIAKPWKFYFNAYPDELCLVSFVNIYTDCTGANTYAHSGTAQIFWP